MKKSLYFLFILALFCLTGCKDALVPKPIKLTCNINTFDAPISCISRSTADADKLYIGQEDGCIIEKVNNNCQTYSINSNRRIYDILEYSEDSLFVGTRDAGLKLLAKSSRQTQTYYIKNKRMNYSVYSMALDDDKQCLYVGTSNGLFRLNLKDGSTSHELTPIQLGKCSKNCGVNKVVIKEKKLYVASEQGLFVGKYSINSLVYWVTYVHNVVYSFYRSMIYCYINSTQRCAGSIVIDIIPTNGADKRKFFPFAPYFPVTNVIKRYFYPYFPAIIGIKGYSFPYFPYLSGIMKIKTALYFLFSRLDWHKTVVFPCLGEIYEGIRSLSWEIPVT